MIHGFCVIIDQSPTDKSRGKSLYEIKHEELGRFGQIEKRYKMAAIVVEEDKLGMTKKGTHEAKITDKTVYGLRDVFIKQNGTKYIHRKHKKAGEILMTYDLNMDEEREMEKAKREYLKQKNPGWLKRLFRRKEKADD